MNIFLKIYFSNREFYFMKILTFCKVNVFSNSCINMKIKIGNTTVIIYLISNSIVNSIIIVGSK